MADPPSFERFRKTTGSKKYSFTVSSRISDNGLDREYVDVKSTRGVINVNMRALISNARKIISCNLILGYHRVDGKEIVIDNYNKHLETLNREDQIGKLFFKGNPGVETFRFSDNGLSLIKNLILGHKVLKDQDVPFPYKPSNITFHRWNFKQPQLNIYTYDHGVDQGYIFDNLKNLIRWLCGNRGDLGDNASNACFDSFNDMLNQLLITGQVPTEKDWHVIMNHPSMWNTGWIESFFNQVKARISVDIVARNMCLGHVWNNNYLTWQTDIHQSSILTNLYNSSVNRGVRYSADSWSLFRFIQNCFAHKRPNEQSNIYKSDHIEAQLQVVFPYYIVHLYQAMLMVHDFQFKTPGF